ncbi:MAG: MBL fold metallo-hydrolase [Anaerolineae bacterium]|nr:MBL fold metallo-hydrolase [Anaerolineae bacterium]
MPTGQALLAQMEQLPILPNSLAIWGMGQMGIAIKGPDALIYIDPCLSDVVRERFGEWWYRAYPPPLAPSEVSNADFYLITHEHMDHLDPMTVGPTALASPEARFVVTGWCGDLMADVDVDPDRLIIPKALEPFTLGDTTLRLTAIPSAHYAKEHDPQKGYRWFGYLIEWNGFTLYHAGDTIIYPDYVETLRKLPKADVAMLPINGRDWNRETEAGAIGNLLPAEAAWLANQLGWERVIVGHNDLYPNNAIPMGQIADAFAKTAPRLCYKYLQPGELWYVVK